MQKNNLDYKEGDGKPYQSVDKSTFHSGIVISEIFNVLQNPWKEPLTWLDN